MIPPIKPLAIALEGKGPTALFQRVWTIGRRFGVTAARADRTLEQLLQILQQFDCRATLPVTAIALARNGAVIREYQAQGIEFAVHGYRHIDHSQLSLMEQVTQLRKASQVFRDQGIHFEGFRCPYLRWNEDTLAALGQTRFAYDSSFSLAWDVEEKHLTPSYYRALDFYGARSAADCPALPYLDTVNKLVRIPYCLPDDEILVERLKWSSPAEMEQVWPTLFHQIHERGELLTLGLHPERIVDCSSALIATLEEARAVAPAVWHARLSDVAAWWKARYNAVVEVGDVQEDVLQLTTSGPAGTTLLLRSLDVRTATAPWFNGYRRASEMPCVVRTKKRPFIGISPDSPPALISFLKQQGYIVEISSRPDSYSLYLDTTSFSRQEERRLMARVEEADFPLARLGRWPYGHRSALAITGDIDALTLWDYGLRVFGR